MTVKIKTLLLGTTIASILSMGQADAFTLSNPFAKKPAPTAQDSGQGGSVPADHENFKSTYIYPLTKKTVSVINSAKTLKEAQDKLCGKSLMSSGLMRQNGGAICKKTPHSAMMALALCEGYPKFDGTDCAQGAKKLLWGNTTDTLSKLMREPIRQSIAVQQIGVDKFTNEFAQKNENNTQTLRTFSEEMQEYANPRRIKKEDLNKYGMTNLRYLLCNSKRENLPQTLRILANETCYNAPMQGASKMQPSKPGMLQQEPSLNPYDMGADTALDQTQENIVPTRRASSGVVGQPPVVGALKDMKDKRSSLASPDWNQPEYGQDDLDLEQAPKTSAVTSDPLRKSIQLCSLINTGQKQNLTAIDVKILLATPGNNNAVVGAKQRLSRSSQGAQAGTGATGALITEAKNLCNGIKAMTATLEAANSPSTNVPQVPQAKNGPIGKPAWMVREPKAQDQANMPDDVREICNNLAMANATDIKNTLEPIYFDSIDSNPNIDDTTKNNIAAGLYSGDILQVRRAGQNICRNLN